MNYHCASYDVTSKFLILCGECAPFLPQPITLTAFCSSQPI